MTIPGLKTPVLWFFGAGEFAVRCLSLLSGHVRFSLVVTSPPSIGGRGLKAVPSPVDMFCSENSIQIFRTSRASSDEALLELFRSEKPNSILVTDFGQMIREPFLSGPPWGCMNIHPSLLPRYRGAAPVQRAILSGDGETGVSLFRLTENMDAGPVLLQEKLTLEGTESAGEVLEILAEKGSRLYILGVKCLIEGTCKFTEQDSESASYAPKILNKEAEFFWTFPALRIVNMARALNPSPGAFVRMGEKRMKLWTARFLPLSGPPGEILDISGGYPAVGTSEGAVELRSVQPEGKRQMDGDGWARGMRLKKGDSLL